MPNPTIVVAGPDRFRIDDVHVPPPASGEVLVALDSAGICGGDISHLRGRNAVASYPTTLGHECAARVEATGPDTALRVGQPVMIYPTIGCGNCRACHDGRFNNCPQMRVLGLSDPRGCFSERFVVPESQCIPIAEAVLDRFGALVEPLAVGVHVVRRGGTRSGETALVIGTGAIGLATALVARHERVRVLGADRHPERATAARDCGLADFTTATGTDLEHWVRTRTHSLDLVYDTVCSPATIDLGIRLLAPGGRFVAIASAKPGHTAAIDYAACYARELAFIACRNYVPDDFRRAAALLESGGVDPTPLHTATFALDEFDKALAALETDGHRHIKVLLTPRDRLGSRRLLSAT